MEAVIEVGGKQLLVKEGDRIEVERIKMEGESVLLDKVLLVKKDDKVLVGEPYIEGAKVVAKSLGEKKGKKIIVFRKKAKTGYKKKRGHRQIYTLLKIEKISLEEN